MRSKGSKIAMFMLTLCMTVSMFVVNVSAADESTDNCARIVEEYNYDDAAAYIDDNDEFTYPTKDGYLFAGWYTDEECDMNSYWGQQEPGDTVYALFVPSHILDVKAQISANLLNSSTEDNSKASIRFVTTVDTLLYNEAGFEVSYKKGDVTKNATSSSNKVYRKLYAVGESSGEDTEYTPEVSFCNLSYYFKACTISNVGADYYGTPFHVTPFWRTMDGSVVYGETVIRSINDYFAEQDVYVSANGTDAEDCGSLSKPFQTLDYAINYVKNGGNVHIIGGLTVAEGSWTAHDKTFNITNDGQTGTDSITFEGTVVNIRDSVKFTGLDLNFTDSAIVCAWGNPLEIANDVGGFANPITLCGGGYKEAITSDTSLTVRAGNYYNVFGGGYEAAVTGDTNIVLTDKVNSGYGYTDHDMEQANGARILYGGGYSGSVTGDTNVSVGAETVLFNYIFAGGRKGAVTGDTHVTYQGKAVSLAGGGWGGTVTGNTYVNMVGGEVEQIWGGCQASSMEGNTHVYVSGGEVIRRIYGGCYNGSSSTKYHVTGYTMVSIDKSAKLSLNYWSLTGNDNSISAVSRNFTSIFEDESGVFIFNDYTNNSTNINKVGIDDDAKTAGIISQTYNHFVRATSGGMVYGAGDGLRVVPDMGKVATVRIGSETGDVIFYTESEGFCELPKLDSASLQQDIYVVFDDATPNDVNTSNYEARIDGAYYDTLEEAIGVAHSISNTDSTDKAVVVTLLKDKEVGATISIADSANITIQNESRKQLTINRSANLSSYMFNVASGATLSLVGVGDEGLTFDGRTSAEITAGTTDVSLLNGCSEVLIRNVGNVYLENTTYEYLKNTSTANNVYGSVVRSGNGSELVVTDCTFDSNYSQQGGVISLHSGSSAEIVTSEFSNSEAAKNGGVLYTTGADVTINGATFKKNRAVNGAAIYIDSGSVSLEGDNAFGNEVALFENNEATTNGGAIFVNKGSLSVEGYEFNTNKSGKWGGAIVYANSTTIASQITNSQFKDNSATGNGGAIYSDTNKSATGHTLTVQDTKFNGNSSSNNGGAIYLVGGMNFVLKETDTENVPEAIFTNNTAKIGGAIFKSSNATGSFDVEGYTFASNTTTSTGGGAVYFNKLINNIEASFTGTTFTGNVGASGGAIYADITNTNDGKYGLNIEDCTFGEAGDTSYTSANTATSGGAIYIPRGNAKITDTSFLFNKAADGGAIHVDGYTVESTSTDATTGETTITSTNYAGTLVATGCTFDGNTATGSATTTDNASYSGGGGAIYLDSVDGGTKAMVTGSTFIRNSATKAFGGAIYTGSTIETADEYGLTVENCTFGQADDTAFAYANTADGNYGGGIFVTVGNAKIVDTSFLYNTAKNAGAVGARAANIITMTASDENASQAVMKGNYASHIGGAIRFWITANGTSITGYNLTSNSSSNQGGAIALDEKTYLDIGKCEFNSNFSTGNAAGALYGTNTCVVTIEATDFIGNYANAAGKSGGAIVAQSGAKLTIQQPEDSTAVSTFQGNHAVAGGGAIYTGKATVTISDAAFSGNYSESGIGGAIWTNNANDKVTIQENTVFEENTATAGGAIYMTLGTVKIDGAEFNKNTASTNGGAICLGEEIEVETSVTDEETGETTTTTTTEYKSATLTATNCDFSENTAATHGGAVNIIAESTATVTGSTFTKNVATAGNGGAIYTSSKIIAEGENGLIVEDCTFGKSGDTSYANKATSVTESKTTNNGYGGAIYITAGNAKIVDTSFLYNKAYNGGAIGAGVANIITIVADDNSSMARFEGNSVSSMGGAIRLWGTASGTTIIGYTFNSNLSTSHGGAIQTDQGTKLGINNCDFNSNKTTGKNNGGAIYMAANSEVAITNGLFNKNIAGQHGGAVWNETGTLSIFDSDFIENEATGYCGAVGTVGTSSDKSTTTIAVTDGQTHYFKNNHAKGNDGGAIRGANVTIDLVGYTFVGNTAKANGDTLACQYKSSKFTAVFKIGGCTFDFASNDADHLYGTLQTCYVEKADNPNTWNATTTEE